MNTDKKNLSIPFDQLDLPVTVNEAGELISLRDAIGSGFGNIDSLPTMTPENRSRITLKRLECQDSYDLSVIGVGLIDKQRAIKEVSSQSEIGKIIIEIESILVQQLLSNFK